MVRIPSSGTRLPFRIDSSVDLPVPEPPMMAVSSPPCSVKLMPCSPLSLPGKRYSKSLPLNTTRLSSPFSSFLARRLYSAMTEE